MSAGFQAKLNVSPDYEQNEIIINTANTDFGEAMLAHVNHFTAEPVTLVVKTKQGYEKVRQAEILYLTVYQHESTLVLPTRTIQTRTALATLISALNPADFMRVAKSTVINIQHLQQLQIAFSGNYYGIIQGHRIVISRRYIQAVKQRLLEERSESK